MPFYIHKTKIQSYRMLFEMIKFYIFESKSRGRAVVARWAHNPKVAGSSPALATKTIKRLYYNSITVFLCLLYINYNYETIL